MKSHFFGICHRERSAAIQCASGNFTDCFTLFSMTSPISWCDVYSGYESGAMIMGTISMVLGGTLGSWFALPQLYKANTFLVPTGVVVILALVLMCGYAIIEKSFDSIPRWYLDGINTVVLVAMPFIIARRATQMPIAP